jgi:hypothetical protein
MSFNEFKKRIEAYYSEDLISDIHKQLPHGTEFSIWSWDVGDYSGDGYNDLAFALKLRTERNRILQVFLFVDIDGFLTKVGQFEYKYIELPLEIGISISMNACYITNKMKQFNWEIKGYRFESGALAALDAFVTEEIGDHTYTNRRNYQSLVNSQKYTSVTSGKEEFYTSYLTIPSYTRGRVVYKGYAQNPTSSDIDYVTKGAYYWRGDEDASFSLNSAFDEEYLYMTIKARDSNVVGSRCDTCPSDYIELWIIASVSEYPSKRFKIINSKQGLSFEKNNEGIYCIKFNPGDFTERKAFVKEISSTDSLDFEQSDAVKNIRVVASLTDNGWEMKFKIPFALFGFNGAPMEKNVYSYIPCTVVLHDIDNEYRSEEETVLATSIFDQYNPLSYGELLLVPPSKWYGESYNIYKEDVLKYLAEYGY